jgi:transposase-like protein
VARKTSPKRLVGNLDGEASTKAQLETILDVLADRKSVADACRELSVSEATFHRLREKVLGAALEALVPKKAGRPPKAPPAPAEVEELKRTLRETRIELEASRIREEIALVMPHLLKRDAKKKTPPPAQEIFGRRRDTERS